MGISSPKEQVDEDSVVTNPENDSPNRDWIPPDDQNQHKTSVSFDWLQSMVSVSWLPEKCLSMKGMCKTRGTIV